VRLRFLRAGLPLPAFFMLGYDIDLHPGVIQATLLYLILTTLRNDLIFFFGVANLPVFPFSK